MTGRYRVTLTVEVGAASQAEAALTVPADLPDGWRVTVAAVRPTKGAPVVDVATLPDRELFAHFKRTAPVEDIRFVLRTQPLTAELRARVEARLAAGPSPADARWVFDAARAESQRFARVVDTPAIGSERWRAALDAAAEVAA